MIIKSNFRSSLLFILTLFSTSLNAEEYLAETDFFGDSPVVLTVSRMNKPLENSPASVSIIDRQMIQNSGAREIADIFQMVPGFIVGYRNGYSAAVTYHGLGSIWQRQLQVYIDGRSVFIPSYGGVPWSNLPLLLEDIERVEITRGPNAVTYGTNAFLATINIITRHAAEDFGSKISVTQDLNEGKEVNDLYFRVGDQVGDLDWRITAGREEDNGFELNYDSKILRKVNLRTDFLTAYNQLWSIQTGINQSSFNRGSADASDVYRDEETSNSYQNIKWELLQDNVTTTIQLTHTKQDVDDNFLTDSINQKLDDIFDISLFSMLPVDITFEISYDRVSDRIDLELFQNRVLRNDATVIYGASIREDKVYSYYLFNDEDTHRITTNRLFSSIEWKYLEDLIIDIGFMLEDSSYIDHELSGRVSVIKKMDDQHSLRLVTSTATRNPLLYETSGNTQFAIELPAGLFPFTEIPVVTWKGTEGLQPESIRSTEIGLFSEFNNRQITTDIKIFDYKLTDQLTGSKETSIDPASGLPLEYRVVKNYGTTTVKGIEASFNYSPKHKNFRLYGGFSRVENESDITALKDSFPVLTTFAGGHINFNNKHQLSTAISYAGSMSWIDINRQLDSHIKLDLRYQYILNRKYDSHLEIIGHNLYEDYVDYGTSEVQQKSLLMRISSRF